MSGPALALWAEELAYLDDDVILEALRRCRCELRGKDGFPPVLTLADILDRAGVVSESQIKDAKARAAWDCAIEYADRFVARNAEGQYEERDFVGNRGRVQRPQLSQQIRDTVRRVGDWRVLKNISSDDFPHVQRRFFEAFNSWQATDIVISSGALSRTGGFQQLVDKCTMRQPKLRPVEVGRKTRG